MDYIYSQLNNTIDGLNAEFTQTIVRNDFIIPVETENKDLELLINTSNLVRLYPIEASGTDKHDQQYQLFGFNYNTKLFDIPLGEPISINCKSSAQQFNYLKFKDGNTQQVIDVGCEIDETGALVLDYVPIAALSDTHILNGQIVEVESIIDGNND